MKSTKDKKLYIVGTGGFSSEVFIWAKQAGFEIAGFIDDYNNNKTFLNLPIIEKNKYDKVTKIVIAIGDPQIRKKVIEQDYQDANFATIIHPSVIIGENVDIKHGSVICPNVILTSNITIGKHSHLNLGTTIGHDCVIGNYFTSAPQVSISGNSIIGDCVYFGTSSALIEKKEICSNTTIGAAACVVKDINKPGIYAGIPAKLLKK